MNDDDLLTDAAPDSPAASAFLAAEAHTFAGLPLQPFSIRRQAAAQALGNRLLSGRAVLDEPLPCRQCLPPHDPACRACAGTGQVHGSYDGMVIDVIALLYLCASQPPQVMRAFNRPQEVLAAALDWAEAQQLALGSPRYQEACGTYYAILADLRRSQFVVPPSRDAGDESPNV